MSRFARAAVPLASGIAYALTTARTIQGGDSAELAAIGAAGGVGHPPGYPLYVLWCRLWQWLPAASPAHRMGLATAIAGALAVMMLERACRAWGARPIAASLAAALFAFSPLAWRLATEPEVFALNTALALGLVELAAPGAWAREDRRAIALAFVAGLGLSNHHSIVLLAPLGLFAWVRAIRRTERKLVTALVSIGVFAFGLLPYVYLTRTSSDCLWGDTSTLGGLLHHVLRRDYGTTRLSTSTSEPEPLGQLWLLAESLVESLVALPLVAAAIGAARRRTWSWATAALAASFVLAGPLFVMRFNLPPRGLFALVVVRFHHLPLALAGVLGVRGIDELIALARAPFVRRVVAAGTLAIVLARAGLSGVDVVTSHPPTIERYLRNVFALVPPHGILIGTGDEVTGGFEYLQCVLGERPDVTVLSPRLMLADWYARRMEAQLGFPIEHPVRKPGARPTLDGVRLLEQLVLSGRPVFLNTWFLPNLELTFPSYPIGPLVRVVRDPSEVLPPPELLARNEEAYAHMTLDDGPPAPDTWAAARHADYARPWIVLADAFDRSGDFEAAMYCRSRSVTLFPKGASSP